MMLILSSCTLNQDKESLFIDPIQCLGNEWDDYPSTEDGRLKIFIDYYESLDIIMVDTYSEWVWDAVCHACSCPTGERYYCTVNESDVEFLLDSGFNLE